ncbi:MAG: hypothetical protein HY301_18520 [Verrucomicrobia bacterium]|nr:hypothetical protein [Verrucomicrobiota bacterium]
MGVKAEIGWTRKMEDGTKVAVCAREHGKRWSFYQQTDRFEKWEPIAKPALDDWLSLLELVERMIPRRRYVPADADQIRRLIREKFPEAKP